MGKPAARLGHNHTCPMTTGPTPHVGGPIIGPGAPTVLVENQPIAVMGDTVACNGPPDVIVMASATVFAENNPVACMGDMTAHGGVIVGGAPTVLVGGSPTPLQSRAMKTDSPICEECSNDEDEGCTISESD